MHILYRIYQCCIAYPLFAIITVIISLTTVIGCSVGLSKWSAYYPLKFWGKSAIRLLFLPVTIEGTENIEKDRSCVFVANHQGFFDILLIFGYLPSDIRWMMKWQIAHWPFIGIAAVRSRQIIVDKRTRASIKKTYDDARATLQHGTSVVLFPEGARTFTGHMGLFRRGAFALADELQLPIVPITINGSFNVMPRTSKGLTNWHPLRLTIHKPIAPVSQGTDNQHYLMEKSYEAIQSAIVPEYQGYRENPDQ